MVTITSGSAHSATVARLLDAIKRRGLTVFAQIDHGAAAHDAGMELGAEVVILFGDPRVGTLLMQADRRVGIELPLRILVWDQGDRTLVGHNDPRELAGVYRLPTATPTLDAMSSLLQTLAAEAAVGS